MASRPRLSELVAALSLSADLGLGQPMAHSQRACLIATRFSERLGLDDQRRSAAYWATMLGTICPSESHELTRLFGDDITYRADSYHVGPSPLSQLAFMVGHAGAGTSLPRRAGTAAGLVVTGRKAIKASLLAHCEVTSDVAARLGLGENVSAALRQTFARWDGKGVPAGIRGDEISIATQLFQLADGAEIHHRLGGVDGAMAMARTHRSGYFSPALVDSFCDAAPELFEGLDDETSWDEVVAAEPDPGPALTEDELDRVLEVMADIADLKSPWFGGHSRGVADLASRAAAASGLPKRDVTTLHRAGLVHDLGRNGIPNRIWDKPGPLTSTELERVRLHAYFAERMLRRPGALAALAAVAASDHERLDGSGYHRAVNGSSIPLLGRYLAAADVYHALLEARPHRPAVTAKEAATHVRAEARAGRLDGAAVEAVLGAAGHEQQRRSAPAGLTSREAEVLILVARGASTRQVAHALDIRPKTAGTHIERIYTKIGVSSRSAATLYAMQHGLLQTLEPIGS